MSALDLVDEVLKAFCGAVDHDTNVDAADMLEGGRVEWFGLEQGYVCWIRKIFKLRFVLGDLFESSSPSDHRFGVRQLIILMIHFTAQSESVFCTNIDWDNQHWRRFFHTPAIQLPDADDADCFYPLGQQGERKLTSDKVHPPFSKLVEKWNVFLMELVAVIQQVTFEMFV